MRKWVYAYMRRYRNGQQKTASIASTHVRIDVTFMHRYGPPMDPPPLPFQVADPEKLRHELVEAGLKDVRVETANHRLRLHSGTQVWNWVTSSNPIGAGMVANLRREQKTEVQRVLDGMLRERSGDGSAAVLNNRVNIGIGTK